MDIEAAYREALSTLYQHYGKTLRAGERFIHEGEHDTRVYFIIDGLAAVFFGQDPQEHMLWLLEPGDFVGELALLDKMPRSASVEALEETRVVELEREVFYELLRDHPALAIKVIRSMGMRMRKLDARYKLYLGYKQPEMNDLVTDERL